MAGTQSFRAKRGVIFSFDPDELVLIEDPKHPLYDVRVTLPLKAGFVANVAKMGVIVPVTIRKIDGRPVVLDGRQRVKAIRQVNAQRKAEGLEPMRINATERKGGAGDAFGVTVSANEHRTEDALREKITKAQHAYSVLARSEEEIANDFGVSVPTVRKWLDMEATSKTPRKPRGKAKAPSVKVLRGLVEHEAIKTNPIALACIRAATGDMLIEDLIAMVAPELPNISPGETHGVHLADVVGARP